jgi:hypothetical protein
MSGAVERILPISVGREAHDFLTSARPEPRQELRHAKDPDSLEPSMIRRPPRLLRFSVKPRGPKLHDVPDFEKFQRMPGAILIVRRKRQAIRCRPRDYFKQQRCGRAKKFAAIRRDPGAHADCPVRAERCALMVCRCWPSWSPRINLRPHWLCVASCENGSPDSSGVIRPSSTRCRYKAEELGDPGAKQPRIR